jgi:phosphonate transport system permease protein
VSVPPRTWRRFTPAETAVRLLAQIAVALLTVWMLARLGIRWDYVADSPAQIGDLVRRMFPPDWRFAGTVIDPMIQTINIATLGTAIAVGLSIPVAFLAATNTTPTRVTYALGRLIMVVSRSVDTLIWALIFIIVVGPGSLAGVLAVAVRSIGFVARWKR